MRPDPSIIVIGGHSRIARALLPLLGDALMFVARRPTGSEREIVIEDYRDIPASVFEGKRCVINCVGISTGSWDDLERVNIDIPHRLGLTAKAAGVRRLVHISSFSVYGNARHIDNHTETVPASDYGRSKLTADDRLLALAGDTFSVAILRLPLIYGGGSLGKLGQLLRWWQRVKIMPVPIGDVSRAMIGTELSAEVIARLCQASQTGVFHAADPQPFTYSEAAQACRRHLFQLPMPRVITSMVERAMPALGTRLFADSRLAEKDNLAIQFGLESRIARDMATVSI